MFSIKRIYIDNRNTFYDYNTGSRESRLLYGLLIFAVGTLCASIFSEPSDNFLAAVITAQSILAGFGFNVLFFLLSTSNITSNPDSSSIEGELRREKLTKLSHEIFSNISYFNLVSILSVFIAIVIMLPAASSEVLKFTAAKISIWLPDQVEIITVYCGYAKMAIRTTLFAVLYILVIESVYTFIRTVGRITFYFRRKLELLHET